MLTVWCALRKNGRNVKIHKCSSDQADLSEALLGCMTNTCRVFDIAMPMWHTKHTKQLNMFRKVTFLQDDFVDPFPYDRFVVEILKME